MGGKQLEECDELDIPVVCFPHNLDFHSHLDKVATRTGHRVSMLKRIAPYLNGKGRASVYSAHKHSVVHPLMLDISEGHTPKKAT